MTKDDFYLKKEEPIKSCLLALREIIIHSDEQVSETIKYGMPCFLFKKKAFAYLWTDKKTREPYILMVEGNLLEHSKLKKGNRARMKTYSVDSKQDIPIDEIQTILKMALDLYYTGKIKT